MRGLGEWVVGHYVIRLCKAQAQISVFGFDVVLLVAFLHIRPMIKDFKLVFKQKS